MVVNCMLVNRSKEVRNTNWPKSFYSKACKAGLIPSLHGMCKLRQKWTGLIVPLLKISQRFQKLHQGRGPWRLRHHATAAVEVGVVVAQGWAPVAGEMHPSRGLSSPIWAPGKISWVSWRAISLRWWVSTGCLNAYIATFQIRVCFLVKLYPPSDHNAVSRQISWMCLEFVYTINPNNDALAIIKRRLNTNHEIQKIEKHAKYSNLIWINNLSRLCLRNFRANKKQSW